MSKRILSIALIILLCFALFPPSMASGAISVTATYAGGVVTVAGTGFTGGIDYTVRIVDTANSSVKAMGQATADGSGNISASVTTGTLGTLSNYRLYVNNADGTLAGTATIQQAVMLYTATIQAGNGGKITAGASGSYAAGTAITLEASANSGYGFDKWSSSGGGTFANAGSASTTFIMPASDVTITANFKDTGSGSTVTTPTPTPTPTPVPVPTQNGTTTLSLPVKPTVDPATGMAAARVEAGSLKELAGQARKTEAAGNKAVIEIKVEAAADAKGAEVEIPRDAFKEAADTTNADIRVDAGIGTVTFDTKAAKSISQAALEGDISIGIERVDKNILTAEAREKVGDRPVYDFTVKAGGSEISHFGGGKVEISIPYTLKPGEEENSVVVYYIDGTGELKTVRGKYDPAAGAVIFTVTHFSKYAVGYNEVKFTDVGAKDWYNEAVGFMAARGIVNGVGGGRFAPGDNVKRADFLIMVMRAYGIELDAGITDNFADAGNKYYTGYLGTAKRLGLVTGVGDNQYAPEAAISRQDMFVVLYRILEKLDELPTGTGGKSLESFKDAGDIAGYGKDAMKLLVETGTVSGDGVSLKPKETSIRAQAAQVLYNLVKQAETR